MNNSINCPPLLFWEIPHLLKGLFVSDLPESQLFQDHGQKKKNEETNYKQPEMEREQEAKRPDKGKKQEKRKESGCTKLPSSKVKDVVKNDIKAVQTA